MSLPIRLIAFSILAVLPGPIAWAQGKGKPAPEEQTGRKVGEKAPGFVLEDQEGRKRSLDEFLSKGKVALVFYRSADW
jgi:cytochrome oxidase Cu insertion factor (SCO1/SenC/PrrC family)